MILFMLCQLPTAIMLIYTAINEIDQNTNSAIITLALGNIFNFLMAINAAGNFILYCLLSQKYRRTLIKTFCPCLKNKFIRLQQTTCTNNTELKGFSAKKIASSSSTSKFIRSSSPSLTPTMSVSPSLLHYNVINQSDSENHNDKLLTPVYYQQKSHQHHSDDLNLSSKKIVSFSPQTSSHISKELSDSPAQNI